MSSFSASLGPSGGLDAHLKNPLGPCLLQPFEGKWKWIDSWAVGGGWGGGGRGGKGRVTNDMPGHSLPNQPKAERSERHANVCGIKTQTVTEGMLRFKSAPRTRQDISHGVILRRILCSSFL